MIAIKLLKTESEAGLRREGKSQKLAPIKVKVQLLMYAGCSSIMHAADHE